jgi:hypothetical protein
LGASRAFWPCAPAAAARPLPLLNLRNIYLKTLMAQVMMMKMGMATMATATMDLILELELELELIQTRMIQEPLLWE